MTHSPGYLRDEQYGNDRNLRRRQSLHQRFSSSGAEPWFPWVFDQCAPHLRDGASVLEVGTGTATLWVQNADRLPRLARQCLTDLSPGMLEAARSQLATAGVDAELEVADVRTLPYPDASFDLVLANHMLYHVDPPSDGIQGIARVLRRDGSLVAATNGAGALRELDDLIETTLGAEARIPPSSFTLENGGEQLRAFFGSVELRRPPTTAGLEVTDADAILEYIRSLPAGRRLTPAVGQRIFQIVSDEINSNGCFRITSDAGVFVATNPR